MRLTPLQFFEFIRLGGCRSRVGKKLIQNLWELPGDEKPKHIFRAMSRAKPTRNIVHLKNEKIDGINHFYAHLM